MDDRYKLISIIHPKLLLAIRGSTPNDYVDCENDIAGELMDWHNRQTAAVLWEMLEQQQELFKWDPIYSHASPKIKAVAASLLEAKLKELDSTNVQGSDKT